MTPDQERITSYLIESGYTYYNEVRGDIILTRPVGYKGNDSNRVSVNNHGTIIDYKGER